jgi:fructokinase
MGADKGVYGGIEAGGSKFVCVVADQSLAVHTSATVWTTTPTETLSQVIAFFRPHDVHSLGLATFGPVDLDRSSPTYGHILSTPKMLWQEYPIVEILQTSLDVPVAVETDVNPAALAEFTYGAGRGCNPLVYLTVGTGIGGGAVVHGHPLHGFLHPEMGHMLLARVPGDNGPSGCPFHQDCLEGLASGQAIRARFGAPETLPPQHQAWALEALYLGQALATIATVLAPERIIIGGGVMHQPHLFPRIRHACARVLNGYLPRLGSSISLDDYIVPPGLGDRAGAIGALYLAREADARSRAATS